MKLRDRIRRCVNFIRGVARVGNLDSDSEFEFPTEMVRGQRRARHCRVVKVENNLDEEPDGLTMWDGPADGTVEVSGSVDRDRENLIDAIRMQLYGLDPAFYAIHPGRQEADEPERLSFRRHRLPFGREMLTTEEGTDESWIAYQTDTSLSLEDWK